MRRSSRCVRARSTTWRRPRSCRRRGSSRGRRTRAIMGSCAAILEAVRDLDSGDARVRVGLRRDVRRRAGEPAARGHAVPADATRTRSPSSPRTSSSACCALTTGCTPARASPSTTSPSAGPSSSSRAGSRAPPPRSASGLQQELTLGSMEAVRDWSFAGDIMHGAWLMLQQEQPDDYVLASGVPHTVAELARDGVRVRGPGRRALRARGSDRWCVRAESTPERGRPAQGARSGSAGSRGSTSRSWWSGWCARTCARCGP